MKGVEEDVGVVVEVVLPLELLEGTLRFGRGRIGRAEIRELWRCGCEEGGEGGYS